MKVLHVTTYDSGGAAIQTIRLHRALLQCGIESKVLVLDNTGLHFTGKVNYRDSYRNGRIRNVLFLAKRYYTVWQSNNARKKYNDIYETFTGIKSLFDITTHSAYKWADIIHLGFVAHFLNWENFFQRNYKPLLWTLHDTSHPGCGFHAVNDHNRFRNLPEMQSILKRKISALKDTYNLKVITPSKWLMEFSLNEGVFNSFSHGLIPHGIELSEFKPLDKKIARQILGLDEEKIILLFSADDHTRKNKGFEHILQIRRKLDKRKYLIITTGNEHPDYNYEKEGITSFGRIQGNFAMNILYSAADWTLVTSRSESFSLVTLESFASGTPVLAFDTTALSELINNDKDGILVAYGDNKAMVENITRYGKKPEDYSRYGIEARKKVEEKYEIGRIAMKYIEEYQNLLK